MNAKHIHRLPAPLEAAAQTLKLAARSAVERTIESLGLAALAAGNAFQRDGLLGAQFELNRKSAVFVLSFNDAFDERVMREAGSVPAPAATAGGTAWDALSLVADHEVEVQISADRFGMDVSHACEWELREFDACVAALLETGDAPGSDRDRNPLRPQIVGHAMLRAIEAVSERADVRKLLSSEISRSLASLLRQAYGDIVADLRRAGVQPRGLSVRPQAPPRSADFEASSRQSALDGARSGYSRSGMSQHAGSVYGQDPITGVRGPMGAPGSGGASGFGPSVRSGMHSSMGSGVGSGPGRRGPSLGQVDPGLMNLIRRLTQTSGSIPEDAPAAASWRHSSGAATDVSWAGAGDAYDDSRAVPNLILAHREELRQASRGSLDHMVIDVIAGLFDQILSDPKVPPQMARLIARLQLPVLRAALGDTRFFSSRRHPVRRFINRIASLGAAFEDYSEPAAQRFLAKVKGLVNEVVEGDFDQIETYESKLRALETFIAEGQAGEGQAASGQAAELLAQKEDEARLRQLYAQRLEGELKGLAGPEFVRDFITRTWSQVMIRAATQAGADSPLVQRLRHAGRELFMSVQPKPTPAARKTFLAELPRLMQDLSEGMNLIAWPEEQRRAFFGQLMPAHAEALKNTSARQLDINLLARQVEGALDQALPSPADLRAAAQQLPVLDVEVQVPAFTAEEAQRVGLVQETAVDWTAPVAPPAAGEVDIDIDIGADTLPPSAHARSESQLAAPATRSDPGDAAEAPEPTRGLALASHVQIGFAYQMQLEGQWQKVRLSHVSPARSFFVFTHGPARAQQTVSLSRRMLEKLCEAGRLRAFEQAFLVERATARARRQLAMLAARDGATSPR